MVIENDLPELAPMEARLVDDLPSESGWQFEPKWDGFRCVAYRMGDAIILLSKSGKRLDRYFPEIVAALASLPCTRFILDGELIVIVDDVLSFDNLQARLHPAPSRIRKLSKETPARFMLFDLLWQGRDDLSSQPLSKRRSELERFDIRTGPLALSPISRDRERALDWLRRSGGALDGVVAKVRDEIYHPGERGFLKVKQHRSADCVVGGFRYASKKQEVGSLLLGLYDGDGLLHHVGFTSGIAHKERPALTRQLEALVETPGFTGRAPGGPSRWSTERSSQWQPLRPELVVEVGYDQVTADRFRHGTKLLRWRPDKAPAQCRMDQLTPPLAVAEIAHFGPYRAARP